MDELQNFPWAAILVVLGPVVLLGRILWGYALKRWLDSLVSRDEMERRFAEEREMNRTITMNLLRSLRIIE